MPELQIGEENFYRIKDWMNGQKGGYSEIFYGENKKIPSNEWVKIWREYLFKGIISYKGGSFSITTNSSNGFLIIKLLGAYTVDVKYDFEPMPKEILYKKLTAQLILQLKLPKLRTRGW